MTCLHHFVEHARLALLYCEHCGEPRSLEAKPVVRDAKPPRRPRAAKAAPGADDPQPQLPFDVPIAINADGKSMFEPQGEPTAEDIAELERRFFGANPQAQAEIIAAMAARGLGGKRVPEGDPPNTYRPGEGETIGRGAGITRPSG